MSARAITTPSAPEPVGPYNQAVLASGWLYCSGQIPIDPASGLMVGNGDVEAETRQVLKNLAAVLDAAGAKAGQVVRCTVYLVDLGDFQAVNAIYAEMFGAGISPARACVQVAALPKGSKVVVTLAPPAGTPKDEWWGRKWPFSACFEEGFAVALHASGF